MVSFLSYHLLLISLIGAIVADATQFPFVLPTSSRQLEVPCSATSDCPRGCGCGTGSSGLKLCTHTGVFLTRLNACRTCSTARDCPGDWRGCAKLSSGNKCKACARAAAIASVRACARPVTPVSSPSSSGSGSGTTNVKVFPCSTVADCKSGCQCIGQSQKMCISMQAALPLIKLCKKCTKNADCVSDSYGCDSNFNVCKSCALQALLTTNQACIPESSSNAGAPTPSVSTGTTGSTSTTVTGVTNTTSDTTTTTGATNTTIGNTETTSSTGTTETASTTGSTEIAGTTTETGRVGAGGLGNLAGSCNSTSTCDNGCICNSELGNVCVKEDVAKSKFKECETCDSDSQCPGSKCDVSLRKCVSCVDQVGIAANEACNASEAKCFPAKALVRTRYRGLIAMDELEIGDDVLVGPRNTYSRVFMFTHRDPDAVSNFVELQTSAGTIRLTSGHMLYANGALVRAEKVKVGDVLFGEKGNQFRVVRIGDFVGRGLYNPQTNHGDIVVDGIQTSTYTEAISPKAGHALLAPLRAVESYLGLKCGLFENDRSVVGGTLRQMST